MSGKHKILIGLDGSANSEKIIDELGRMGLPESVEVFVASVSEMWFRMPLSYGGVETSYVNDDVSGVSTARKIAASGVERIRQLFPQWSADYGAAAGSPSGILLAKADEWNPDLILVGAHSRGGIGRFFLGSVAQSLVNNAGSSVRVVRIQDGKLSTKTDDRIKIVIGADGSPDSARAVDEVIARYRGAECEVRLVSALDYLVPLARFEMGDAGLTEQPNHQQETLEKTRVAVNGVMRKLEAAGFEVTSAIENEAPADLLIRQADEIDADCIFVGAKGMSRFERLMVGSVSAAVAARANCSVEVVRARNTAP